MRLTKRHLLGFAIGIVTSSPTIAAGQAGHLKTVNASVLVTTSEARRNVAVLSRGAGREPAFLFCIDLETPQKIEFTGPARVVYRPLPLGTFPRVSRSPVRADVSVTVKGTFTWRTYSNLEAAAH